jgi:Family of unknown function (DUF6526)
MSQTYSNHRHRAVSTLVVYALEAGAIASFGLWHFGWRTQPWTLAFLIAAVIGQTYVSRSYALRLQDRIIRMELRYRTDKLLAPDMRAALWRLSKSQIIALRFASDAELPGLIARAEKEQLAANDIKKAIKDWQRDDDRT